MKVLIIGPFSPPITGVGLANDVVFKNFSREKTFDIDRINNSYPTFKEDLGKFSFKKVGFYFRQYFSIYKVLKAQIIYITLGQTFFGVLKYAPFIVAAKMFRKKIIFHIHGNYLRTEYNNLKGFKSKIIKVLVSSAEKGIVLSELLLPNLEPFIPQKDIFILPNFVEKYLTDKFSISFKETNTLRVVFLSNLMTEKGILDLLEALQILSDKKIKFTTKIAGNIEASIRGEILSKINANNSIEYLGVVNGQSKKELLIWSNVFVFPTYYAMEGQPISLLEAMATGNIVLSTRHAGIPDIFSIENGFFINKRDPKDIVNKLEHIVNNLGDLKTMMLNNHKYASTKFTEEKFINSLKTIFSKE